MRPEESAFMDVTTTVLLYNPKINVRFWSGPDPLRVTIDKDLKLPESADFFDDSVPTLVFTSKSDKEGDAKYCKVDFSRSILPQIMDVLYRRNVQSLIVEGGSKLLQTFISESLWDEAQIEVAGFSLGSGIKSPVIRGKLMDIRKCENSIISIYKNDFIP
jgi:diaminohydroxyphosphoribosylaminopyrimidine deaminase/5-amino-6-(5-phosphoribosylamino)uracil reductase